MAAKKQPSWDNPQVWSHKGGKLAIIVYSGSETHSLHIALQRHWTPAVACVHTPTAELLRTYVPDEGTPIDKVAELYKQHALALGASSEAMTVIGRFVTISEEELNMATAKTSGATAPKKPSPPPKATKAEKPAAEPKAPKAAKAPAEPKEKKPSAAARFQDLIMEGKRTDDEIFAIVQKEFGLPDSKRNYVSWYRNYLKKQGKAPPPAVGGDAPAKETTAPKKPAAKETAASAPKKSGPPRKKD